MSVTERFQDPGAFAIPLESSAQLKQILRQIREFGHIVILPQRVLHPAMFDEADLLAKARFAGPVVGDVEFGSDMLNIRGHGMWWWMGDQEGKGDLIESEISYSAASLSAVLAARGSGGILPAAITVGSIINTGLGTFTGPFSWATPLEAFRTVAQTLGVHARINPNGTIDACSVYRDEVYVVTNPQVVVVRHGWGYDPTYLGVESQTMTTHRDGSGWVSKAVVLDEDADGALTLASSQTRLHTYHDINGNPLIRTVRAVRLSSDATDVGDFLINELVQRGVNLDMEIDTDQWQLKDGSMMVGDHVWVFDPPSGFFDRDNQIRFRGQVLAPKRARIWEADWSLQKGMGVYYRPPDSDVTSADWIDLTRFVAWEAGVRSRIVLAAPEPETGAPPPE